MSGYNARRAPNVSRYLANLNTMPSPQDLQQQQQQNLSLADDSLDFLTNTEFFDFDQFNPAAAAAAAAFDPHAAQDDLKDAQAFQYDFSAYQPHHMASPSTLPPSPPNGMQNAYSAFAASPVTGDKRKASIAMPTPTDLEEVSRMAAEEDKRRRNTAASARFRVKKKQREQALEKQAKEMSDKVQQLESKVQQLEMENKWLKELITEKTDGVKAADATAAEKKAAVATETKKESKERSTESRTDGVGTAVEASDA